MIGYRNQALAEKAWHCNKHRFCNRRFASEFKDGFIQGFSDVASGGNGCTPTVAPSQYWGWKYQSAQGQQAINAFFEGFPMGVQAAEEAGVGHWQTISPMGRMPNAAAAGALMPAIPADNGANPFYSDQEFIPAPIGTEESDEETDGEFEEGEEVEEMEDAETVFNEMLKGIPVDSETAVDPSALVSQAEIAKRHEAAVAARVSSDIEDSTEVAEVVIEDIFGPPNNTNNTDSDSQELPFSFE